MKGEQRGEVRHSSRTSVPPREHLSDRAGSNPNPISCPELSV